MSRVYNFSAGPATLPEPVLEQARDELLSWQNCGLSVLEMSHRGEHFSALAEALEADLRELLSVPQDYRILFLQGGATAQFSLIPQNILGDKTKACYVSTGFWSEKAAEYAGCHCQVTVSASSKNEGFRSIPANADWSIDQNAAYLHYTANETINGVEFFSVPDSHGLPLVSDMSSNILTQQIDVARFGLIYAGAQKNMGPAGVTVVIINNELLARARDAKVAPVFNYASQAQHMSLLNTPPTFNWYLTGLVLKWTKSQGGVAAFEQLSAKKSARLYQAIDQSSLYINTISPACRSRMNIPFTLADTALEPNFLAQAEASGLVGLKGHRLAGGLRASLYNAMPVQGVMALIDFMAEFERVH